MTLHAQLENLFKFRINSNEEIIPFIKKLSEAGKFDEPKKVAVLAIILDRLGKLEDEASLQDSLKADDTESAVDPEPKVGQDIADLGTTDNIVVEPEIPAQTETETSPDAAQESETTPSVQTPVETTPQETPSTEETPTEEPDPGILPTEATDTGTVSEFSLDAISDKPESTPEVEPTTTS